ncbi:MAG: methyltransferase domain-containing protein [Pseudomonadales bacterium]|nr:methyltransferase domain-containing protein [Pseudomonadales bacterium]
MAKAMQNVKLKQPLVRNQVSNALRRKLNKQLEEAGIAFDKTYAENRYDQSRVVKLRHRAKTLAQKVLSKQADNVDALNLLGRIALDQGNLTEASAFIDQGLDYEPTSASLLYSRAHVFLARQDYAKAEAFFAQAEKISPKATRSRASIAYTRTKQGLYVEAFADYRELIKLDPTDPHIRAKLFECLAHIQADYYAPELEQELIGYLDFTQVDHNNLSSLITSLLIHKYDLVNGNSPLDPQQLSQDLLLNKALRKCQFKNSVIEEFLTACRQCILQESIDKQKIDDRFMDFLVSISLQCINNEFVYAVSLTEEKVLAELHNIVAKTVILADWQTAEVEYPLLLLSMYCQLHHYGFRAHLLRKSVSAWSKQVQLVIQPHLYDPQQELEIKRSVESISDIENTVSRDVCIQYEESPYPRWTALNYATKTDYGQALAAELHGFSPPSFMRNQTIRVLVAGCGTGRHAIQVAKYFRNVEVTAIDLSRASLAYATKMARDYKVSNIEFYQADILALNEIREKFHIIECSGVLHHMQTPMDGWQNLVKLLEPGGLIKVGLYSQRARTVVTRARQLIEENQLTASNEHIRIFRQAILDNLIEGDFTSIKQSADFYNLSGCRDLLFNVQEHQFTPRSIDRCVNSLGLDFLGFVNLPYAVKNTFDSRFSADPARTCLQNWDQLEEDMPDIFGLMFQFYCQLKSGSIAKFPD